MSQRARAPQGGLQVASVGAPELSEVQIVLVGSFNPAIVHPRWLADKEIIPQNLAEDALRAEQAQPLIVTPQLSIFAADWLYVRITQAQAVVSTVDAGRDLDLRDVVRGILEALPETPVDALGLNAKQHFRTESDEAWHAFGDKFLPKNFWEPLFEGNIWKPRSDGNSGRRS